ncbi:hypothetical protein [Streptomyces benahoarensis]|uniref:hypothetical protein n=1 Tax=Streptomyces benahoarensis TaxID=2595054 RepID=UPI00163DD7A2|nr:hypothetical protein [Streptomyces benahoarensis]
MREVDLRIGDTGFAVCVWTEREEPLWQVQSLADAAGRMDGDVSVDSTPVRAHQ